MKKNKEKSEENKKKIDENSAVMISLSPDSTEYHKLEKENEKLHKENLKLNKELKTEEEKQLMILRKKRESTVNSMNSVVPVIHIKDQLDWVNIAKYQKHHLDKAFYETHKNLVKESILNSKLVGSSAD